MRVLLITSAFPPSNMVGAIRPYSFFKACLNNGLDCTVLTANETSDFSRMVRIDKNRIQLLYSKRHVFRYMRYLIYPEYRQQLGLLSTLKFLLTISDTCFREFDIIVATSPDLWTLSAAREISKITSVPYIIDFRDVYEQEKGMPRSIRESINVIISTYLRNKCIRESNGCVFVSRYIENSFRSKYNVNGLTIYNGWNDEYGSAKSLDIQSGERVVRYFGRLLNLWYRDLSPFIEGINNLNERGYKCRLELYGIEEEYKLFYETKYDSLKCINFLPFLTDRTKLISLMSTADVLIVLSNLGIRGVLTTKMFEYLPLNAPIIFGLGDDPEVDYILSSTEKGFQVRTKEDLENRMADIFRNRHLYKGNSKVEEYSRSYQMQKLITNLPNLL